MIPRDNKVLNQDKAQNKKYSQNLQKFVAPKGITHQMLLKLMKAIMRNKITISMCKSKLQT